MLHSVVVSLVALDMGVVLFAYGVELFPLEVTVLFQECFSIAQVPPRCLWSLRNWCPRISPNKRSYCVIASGKIRKNLRPSLVLEIFFVRFVDHGDSKNKASSGSRLPLATFLRIVYLPIGLNFFANLGQVSLVVNRR